MKNNIVLFYVPCRNKKEAIALSKKCLSVRLCACTNLIPIDSFFLWKKKTESSKEVSLILKTIPSLSKKLKKFINENHTYEIPCIATLEGQVNKEYFKWMESELCE